MVPFEKQSNSVFDLILILVFVIIMTSILVYSYYQFDRYEPEPVLYLVIAFTLGMIATILSISSHIIFTKLFFIIFNFELGSFELIVIIIPFFEELAKSIMIILIARKIDFDGPIDGIIYGVMVGSGFAIIENLYFGLSELWEVGLLSATRLIFLRGGYSYIGHPLYSGLVGYGIGLKKVIIPNDSYIYYLKALLMHISWNFVFYLPGLFTYNILLFILSVISVVGYSIVTIKNDFGFAVKLDKELYNAGYYSNKRQYTVYKIQK